MSIDIHVLHRGIGYDLSLLPDDTLAILGTRLETLTAIPAARQKFLYKGKKSLSHPCDHNQRCGFDPWTQSYHAWLDGSRAQ